MKKELFEKIGLSKKEEKVYLATLKIGPAPVSKIARETNFPRQTVYSIIKMLADRGFVDQSDRAGVIQFSAEPEKLLLVLQKERRNIEKNEVELEKLIPELKKYQERAIVLPKVKYYEGEEVLKNMFTDILSFYKKGGEKLFRGYGINRYQDALGDFLHDFARERYEQGVITNLFIGNGDDDFGIIDESKRFGRNVKRLAMDPQHAGFYIVGDRLYLFSYKTGTGIVVENKEIADLLKAAFDDHWSKTES